MSNELARVRTLRNNVAWLKSFGCEVRHHGGSLLVTNPAMPEYCAWLLLGTPPQALARASKILESGGAQATPQVYVDAAAASRELTALLAEGGFESTTKSTTKGGLAHTIPAAGEFSLRQARADESVRWAAVYSEGFGRGGYEAEADALRWGRAFRSRHVRHWFILRRGEVAGVCQTCEAHGVVGIYSFTLLPAPRDGSSVWQALRALHVKVTERGSVYVYFERVWADGASERLRLTPAAQRMAIIRRMTGYTRAG